MEKIEYTITDFHSGDEKCRGTLADLILDAYIIPTCGLIPPFQVLKSILRSGGGNGGMSPSCTWDPIELAENDYYRAVECLEAMTHDDLKFRHRNAQIVGEIRPDYDAPETDDQGEWMQSLVNRGYLPGGPFRPTRR